ncbi:hypothetical protein [Asticcacaulis endophyticus]|uniref:Uncharacterized protein n=1 Tax=Asticcacaulis endophyticus TaxID=1395890 RepID=A0A918PRY9_9CAUL|nr:hypothetical protein [Asticcacaulis endophyticus]GGZ21063.1 hypothetical protein GCM10011273_02150 [Asticcacaulis endophyticus]
MATPIRPSLADALRARPNASPTPATPVNAETARLDAQRAFFQKVLGNTTAQPAANTPATIAPARTQVQPAITPATFKAADIASNAGAENLTPLRPGSLLNIIV